MKTICSRLFLLLLSFAVITGVNAEQKLFIAYGAPVTPTVHHYTNTYKQHDRVLRPASHKISLTYNYYVNRAADLYATESYWRGACQQYTIFGEQKGFYAGNFRVTKHSGTAYDSYSGETFYKRTYQFDCHRLKKSGPLEAAFRAAAEYYFAAAEYHYNKFNQTGATEDYREYARNTFRGSQAEDLANTYSLKFYF